MHDFVTGGTGYISPHTTVELMQAGLDVVIVDNFCNNKQPVLDRIKRIVGRRPEFVEADVRDRNTMKSIFSRYRLNAVIYFAGLKAVGESVEQTFRYSDNNVHGSLVLFETMAGYAKENF